LSHSQTRSADGRCSGSPVDTLQKGKQGSIFPLLSLLPFKRCSQASAGRRAARAEQEREDATLVLLHTFKK